MRSASQRSLRGQCPAAALTVVASVPAHAHAVVVRLVQALAEHEAHRDQDPFQAVVIDAAVELLLVAGTQLPGSRRT